ncbi:uncharacterized protein LOC121367310 [Gigantopelta aegis]|uniref:uncharacterized protein LOC121367310 n=1 Tax=Gigantopelta aegis TaxID=1735272 RepID=UPI001B88BC46|nr:uncharacterized protein LOC121367310 [Gigantopelta aegis]
MANAYLNQVYIFGLGLLVLLISGADAEVCYRNTYNWNGGSIMNCPMYCCGSENYRYCCNMPVWMIVILVIGIILLISLIITGVCCYVKRRGRPGTVIQTATSAGVPFVYQPNTCISTTGVPSSAIWTPPSVAVTTDRPAHGVVPPPAYS